MENIILVGYMGAGKSTVARELRIRTGMTAIDTDYEIERIEGRKIKEIFEKDGEEAFRKMEENFLERLVIMNFHGIISTGGGMPIREENRFFMHQLGQVLYLKACAETIYERIAEDESRPLLAGLKDRDAKIARIHEMLEKRDPIYMKAADEIIPTDGMSPVQIAEEILLYMSYQ